MSTMFQITLPKAIFAKGWKSSARAMKTTILSMLFLVNEIYAR